MKIEHDNPVHRSQYCNKYYTIHCSATDNNIYNTCLSNRIDQRLCRLEKIEPVGDIEPGTIVGDSTALNEHSVQ